MGGDGPLRFSGQLVHKLLGCAINKLAAAIAETPRYLALQVQALYQRSERAGCLVVKWLLLQGVEALKLFRDRRCSKGVGESYFDNFVVIGGR